MCENDNNQNPEVKRGEIKFTVTLLEDLHIGSGLGVSGLYDSGQILDDQGRPFIPYTTFRGVLRDACQRLIKNYKPDYESIFYDLFNVNEKKAEKESKTGESLSVSDLKYKVNEKGLNSKNELLIYNQTEIDSERKTAKEKSLRGIQVVPRGTVFEGTLSFRHPHKEAEKFLIDALKFIKSLGGKRRRGIGLVKIDIIESKNEITEKKEEKTNQGESTLSQLKDNSDLIVLRLLLKNIESLCITKGEQATFKMECLDYIPGSVILGAFRQEWGAETKNDIIGKLLSDDGAVSFGHFLPIPAIRYNEEELTHIVNGANLPPIFIPDSFKRDKRSRSSIDQKELVTFDWAFKVDESYVRFSDVGARDTLFEKESEGGDRQQGYSKSKRFTSEIFCFKHPQFGWIAYSPKKVWRMRNRILPEKQSVSDENGLFATEYLVEGQYFVGDIVFRGDKAYENAKNFIEWAGKWLKGKEILRIGRHRRAILICNKNIFDFRKIINFTNNLSSKNINENSVVLTFCSPLCIRSETGGYLHTLSDETLKEALIEAGFDKNLLSEIKISEKRCLSEHRRGFHFSGLPEFSRELILPGTTVVLSLKDNLKRDEIIQNLSRIGVFGIGEGKLIGYGRFYVNHPVHFEDFKVDHKSIDDAVIPEVSELSSILRGVKKHIEKFFDDYKKSGLSATQWSWLISMVEYVKYKNKNKNTNLISELDKILTESEKTKNGGKKNEKKRRAEKWKSVWEKLKPAAANISNNEEAKAMFIIWVCRRMRTLLKRREDE